MNDALLLVFANKQDLVGGTKVWPMCELKGADSISLAMTPQEVQERLKLTQLKDKIWYVVPSCATTGEGLFEGLVSFVIGFKRISIDSSTGLAFE